MCVCVCACVCVCRNTLDRLDSCELTHKTVLFYTSLGLNILLHNIKLTKKRKTKSRRYSTFRYKHFINVFANIDHQSVSRDCHFITFLIESHCLVYGKC